MIVVVTWLTVAQKQKCTSELIKTMEQRIDIVWMRCRENYSHGQKNSRRVDFRENRSIQKKTFAILLMLGKKKKTQIVQIRSSGNCCKQSGHRTNEYSVSSYIWIAARKMAKYKIGSKLWSLQERIVKETKIRRDGCWTQFVQ